MMRSNTAADGTRTLIKKRRSLPITGAKLLLICFFTVSVIAPLITMLTKIAQTDVMKLISSAKFLTALQNSVVVSGVSTLFSVALSSLLAWIIHRSNIRLKAFFSVAFLVPMLIPSISHGMGLIIMFGNSGIITEMFGIDSFLYDFWGIVAGSVIYSFPIAYIMISDILKYQDSTPYEAAAVFGVPKYRQFSAITLPFMRKPMISVLFAVFTMIITDYGVPLKVGGRYKTLPVMMYEDVTEQLDFGKGAVIGLFLLAPAVAAFLIDLINKDRANLSFVIKKFAVRKNLVFDIFSYIICCFVTLLVALPIFSFVLLTFVEKYPVFMNFSLKHIENTLGMRADEFLLNSIIIAAVVSVIGAFVASLTAYYTSRVKSKSTKILHLISITSLAIPGLVLGLSYAMFFKGSFVYNTLAILMLVNLVHFFASPYLMMYNTFGKINENLEAVGQTLGVGRLRIVLDVILPQAKSTVFEIMAYFFINSMMTISAVSFLFTSKTQPISLMIPNLNSQGGLESSAFISLVILVANIIIKLTVSFINRKRKEPKAIPAAERI